MIERSPIDVDEAPLTDSGAVSVSDLTSNQHLFWIGQQLNPDIPLYNMIQTFSIAGRLNPATFEVAFRSLVNGSDVLRTTIHATDSGPKTRVEDAVKWRLDFVDLSSADDPDSAYAEWLSERKRRALKMDEQLFDSALIKRGEERFVWYLCQHHLITDGQSFALTFQNMAQRYALAAVGRLTDAPALPCYAEYVSEEHAYIGTEPHRQAIEHWHRRLDQPAQKPEFYGRSGAATGVETKRLVLDLGANRSAALHAIAVSEDFASLSPNLTLHSLWATLVLAALHRITGERAIRLGMPFEARSTAIHKQTMGLFMEIGLLTATIDRDATFPTLNADVMEEVFDGLRYARPGISSAQINNAYSVLLNYVTASMDEFAGWPVTTEWVHSGFGESNHTLGIQVCDFNRTGQFVLHIDVNESIFDEPRQSWFIDQFTAVIDAFIADPRRPIGSFDLLSETERKSYVDDFNRSDMQLTRATSVVELFESQASRTPDAVAVFDGERTLTYAAFNTMVNQFAARLDNLGVGRGSRIAICVPRSIEFLVVLWGALKAGVAFAPIDPANPRQRIRALIDDLDPALVVLSSEPGFEHDIRLSRAVIDTAKLDLDHFPSANPSLVMRPDDIAYFIFTSGSTGRPKAAMLSHGGLLNYVAWAADTYIQGEPHDFALYSSIAFDLTLTSIFTPLIAGGTIRVYQDDCETTGLEILKVFADDAVDVVKLTPAHLELVRSHGVDCRRIAKLILGGEDLKTQMVLSFLKSAGRDVQIYNEYGPTEASIGCMVHRFNKQQDCRSSVPIGGPAANMRIYVRDEYGQPVPSGVTGEMMIAGPGVALGYWQRDELTAERFGVESDNGIRRRLYRTGDLARWGIAGIEFLGRTDDQVKLRGARIELGEIENVLLEHSAIRTAAVTVHRTNRPDADARGILDDIDYNGTLDEDVAADRLAAYYVGNIDRQAINEFLVERLPVFMVPSLIVRLDTLPLTPNGKVDRRRLPDPTLERRELETQYLAPSTPLETQLAGIWSDVMDMPHIGVNDNIFRLGGDSIIIIRISAQAQAQDLDVSPRQLFLAPTIRELATLLTAPRPAKSSSLSGSIDATTSSDIERVREHVGEEIFADFEDIYPLTPIQVGLLFHAVAAPGSELYVGQVSCALDGDIEVDAIKEAWSRTIARHPALRTRFFWDRLDNPLQAVNGASAATWQVLDWRDGAGTCFNTRLDALRAELMERGFDLSSDVLMRFTLVLEADDRAHLVWDVHHILLDGWSAYPVFKEWLAIYNAIITNTNAALPSTRPFGDYVRWQSAQVNAASDAFWRDYLKGFDAATPLARATQDYNDNRTARFDLELDAVETRALEHLARRSRVTLNSVFQAAWAILVSRYTGSDDVVFGTTVSGRNVALAGVENIVGLLLNSLPVRLKTPYDLSVGDWLPAVQDAFAAVSEYEWSALSDIHRVSELSPDQELFDNLLVFENYPSNLERSGSCLEIGPLSFNAPSHYPLAVLVYPEAEIRCSFIYKPARLANATIERMAAGLRAVLGAMAANPKTAIGDLDVLSVAEREQLLSNWNPQSTVTTPQLVVEQIARQSISNPNATAVSCGDDMITYVELEARSHALAVRLKNADVSTGEHVAIEATRSINTVIAMLGIWKAGATFVPLDPNYPPARLRDILTDADTRVFVGDGQSVGIGADIHCIKPGLLPEAALSHELPSPRAEDPAYVLYTSGSSGKPKGVIVTHGNIAHSTAARPSLYPGRVARFLVLSSFAFDSSMAGLFWTLCDGGEVLLPDPDRHQDIAYLVELIAARRVTHLLTLPSFYEAILESATDTRLASLSVAIVAGEACWPNVFAAHKTRCPKATLYNEYGPTEATVWSHVFRFPISFDDAIVPIGRPLEHVYDLVLDKQLRPVPIGVPGELVLGGPSIARGYLNDDDLTNEQFIELPESLGFDGAGRFYRSGDLVRRCEDGDLQFLGRTDEQLKVRGFRVEPAEIERALVAHPDVNHAAVVKAAGRTGQLVAWYMASTPSEEATLRSYAQAALPRFMVPDRLVACEAFPTLPNGKIDRHALARQAATLAKQGIVYRAPETEIQEHLARLWADVLQVDNVGIDDNFHSLGGDSIAAMRLAARAHRQGLMIVPADIIQHPTIYELSLRTGTVKKEAATTTARMPARFELAGLEANELDELLDDLEG